MDKKEDIILNIKEVIRETDTTITIVFDKKDLKYKPGQYLLLKIPYEDKIFSRAYSLSTSPFIDEFPAITIKRVKGGKISNYLNDEIKVNHKIISTLPKGNFTIECHIENQRNIVCIAAGSGITPLMSIIKSILIKESKSRITLIYVNRNETSIIFKNFLKKIENKYKNRFKIIHILTQPESSWKGLKGRPDYNSFQKLFKNFTNTEIFLCGPKQMMENAISALKSIGVNDNCIHWESFGNINTNIDKKINSNFEKSKVKIAFEDNQYEIEVNADETILEAALNEDIDLPFACSSGTCNVCQAICKKGKVEMENDEGLTQEEIEKNYILTCVSKPKTTEIEIEIPNI